MTDVAVIGAGAAGLVTAYELDRAGHRVSVFERSARVGGVWVYEDSGRRTMYESLRTNLPRDLMAFRGYPFDSRGGGDDGWPRFPSHTRVLEYLEGFARDLGVLAAIEFETEVTAVTPAADGWRVATRRGGAGQQRRFGAVAVCNGHFDIPREIEVAGAEEFPGLRMHSHDYRHPGPFRGLRVAVVGTGSSGSDLALEIASVAEHVYWCGEGFEARETFEGVPNLTMVPMLDRLTSDGHLLTGGEAIAVDALFLCTGYHYDFSFIETGIVSADDDAPEPLYQHLVPIGYPTLALIGIPQRIIPFPLFEMQAKWFAAVLTGQIELPPVAGMRTWLEQWRSHCRAEGRARYRYRNLGDEQFDYIDELAAECGAAPLPDWYRPLAAATQRQREAHRLDYRDRPISVRSDSPIVAGG